MTAWKDVLYSREGFFSSKNCKYIFKQLYNYWKSPRLISLKALFKPQGWSIPVNTNIQPNEHIKFKCCEWFTVAKGESSRSQWTYIHEQFRQPLREERQSVSYTRWNETHLAKWFSALLKVMETRWTATTAKKKKKKIHSWDGKKTFRDHPARSQRTDKIPHMAPSWSCKYHTEWQARRWRKGEASELNRRLQSAPFSRVLSHPS